MHTCLHIDLLHSYTTIVLNRPIAFLSGFLWDGVLDNSPLVRVHMTRLQLILPNNSKTLTEQLALMVV